MENITGQVCPSVPATNSIMSGTPPLSADAIFQPSESLDSNDDYKSASGSEEDEFHDPIETALEEDDDKLTLLDSDLSDDDEAERAELEALLSLEDIEMRKEEAAILKEQGNQLFKLAQYGEAKQLYTQSLKAYPLVCTKERSILYSNRAATRIHLTLDKKHDEKTIKDCTKSIALDDNYMKPLVRRALIYRKMGSDHLDNSLLDYKKIFQVEPQNKEAARAIYELEEEIRERNEKLKEDMMGKLKDLGNLVLKPFGLSTNNFQLQQNPDSGGYSINFKQ